MIFIKLTRILCVFLSFLLYINSLDAKQEIIEHHSRASDKAKSHKHDNIMCVTIPKSGTHLLVKCLALLNLKNLPFAYNEKFNLDEKMRKAIERNKKLAPDYDKGAVHIPSVGVQPPQYIARGMKRGGGHVYKAHWPYTRQSEQFFDQHTKANFFVIRDPRDMIVSMAFFVHKGPDGLKMDVNDLIFDFIDGRQQHFVPWAVGINETYPLLYELGVTGFYKLYLPWMKARKFCTVKFENLIGSKGGGSDEAQLLEIKNIAKYLGLNLNDSQVKKVIDNLFGQSSTFREGQIGSWKKYFTVDMKAAFKKAPGACELLIALGYEKDTKW